MAVSGMNTRSTDASLQAVRRITQAPRGDRNLPTRKNAGVPDHLYVTTRTKARDLLIGACAKVKQWKGIAKKVLAWLCSFFLFISSSLPFLFFMVFFLYFFKTSLRDMDTTDVGCRCHVNSVSRVAAAPGTKIGGSEWRFPADTCCHGRYS